uniref:CD59 glycoprotein n=1 Tax=Desmodus rotundus TaxID=9430 RepID=K9IWC5_DESRO|nr:CD59 glycoprotein [Desmodus rotundus]
MGSKGFILLGLLLILSVLCHSGHSLQCYTCLNPGGPCTHVTNCTPNFDACLSLYGEVHTYYQCWTFADCNFNYLSQHFGERKLWYNCCQKDLCNRSAGTSITGTTVLLVTQLLTAFWKFFI